MESYKHKELIYLTELGQYLKSVLEFCFLREQLNDRIEQIKWNIQWFDLSMISGNKKESKEYFLEIVIVLNSPILSQTDKGSTIKAIENYFTIQQEQPTIREIDGNTVEVTRMQDAQKERFNLTKGGSGIPERLNNYEATISIESQLRNLLPSPKLILSSDEIKNQERKLIDELIEERSIILKKLDSYQKPIVICEGKTDVKIIKTAWEKLYPETDIPFQVVPSGVWLEIDKSEGNADQIRRLLELYAPINPESKICIGLFDNDKEGNDQFKGLNKNIFDEYEKVNTTRKHKKHNIYGMLLPVPDFRSKYFGTSISHRFFVIEHYFSDEILNKYNMVGDNVAPDSAIFEISGDKENFSNLISQLDEKEFENFKTLFEKINLLLTPAT